MSNNIIKISYIDEIGEIIAIEYDDGRLVYASINNTTEDVQEFLLSNTVQAYIPDLQLQLERAKFLKKEENFIKYNSSLNVYFIEGSEEFKLELLSKKGQEFLQILQYAQGSCDEYQDKVEKKKVELTKAFKISEMIISFNNSATSRRCKMYNWFWQFVFEEIITIKQKAETLYAGYLNLIDEASTVEELDKIDIMYNNFQLNVPLTIQNILKIDKAFLANGREVSITKEIKNAIQAKQVIFERINTTSMVDEVDAVIKNSYFTIKN